MHRHIHTSTVPKSQKVKKSPNVRQWVDWSIVAYTCNKNLFSHKDLSIAAWYNVYEIRKHYAKWKKSDIRLHIISLSRISKLRERECRLALQAEREQFLNGNRVFLSGGWKCFRTRSKWWSHNTMSVLWVTGLFTAKLVLLCCGTQINFHLN